MKKLAKLVAVILVVCSILSIFSACGDKNNQTIDEKITAAYIAEHPNRDANELSISHYGEFNDAYVVVIIYGNTINDMYYSTTIDGINFYFEGGYSFSVYRKGKLCELAEAFDRGWLTRADLIAVRDKHREGRESLYNH